MSTPQEHEKLTARVHKLEAALRWLADNGTSADLTPTRPQGTPGQQAEYLWWASYMRAADESVRNVARRALEEG